MCLRERLVEATLADRDKRFVERCDVGGILAALEMYGIYSVAELAETLGSSFTALQLQLGGTIECGLASCRRAGGA